MNPVNSLPNGDLLDRSLIIQTFEENGIADKVALLLAIALWAIIW